MGRAAWVGLSVLFILLPLAGGCATIVNGGRQVITVDSTPPGAKVRIDEQVATAPAAFQVPKGRDCTVEVFQGTEKRVVVLRRRLDPVTLFNLIPPLWPGFIVDAISGAITRYEPDTLQVKFPRQSFLTQFYE